MPAKISRDDLIDELHRLANELGKTPTRVEMNDHGQYSRTPYDTEFGGWNQALDAAGLDVNKPVELSADQLKRELKRVADELDKTPTMVEFREHSKYTERAYKSTFGSWNNALKAVGLEVNKRHDIDYPTLVCRYCGEEYQVRPSRKRGSKYCSDACKDAMKEEWTGDDNPHPNAGERVDLVCEWCGEEYEVYPFEADKSRFCSRECLGRHHRAVRSGEDSPRWNGGAIEWRGPNWDEQRKQVLERDNYECVECGYTQSDHKEEYGQALNVHHIRDFADFNGDYERANRVANLVTLCQECHGLYEHLPVAEQKKRAFEPLG